MTRDARGPYAWLGAFSGLVAALVWALLAVSAAVMDNDPSLRALVAGVALSIVGFSLAPVLWTLGAPQRAKRPPSESAQMRVPGVMGGLGAIGMGAAPILDGSLNAWQWAVIAVAWFAGGLSLGVAFMGSADQAALSDAPRQPTARPQSGG